jgi:hypothetical protein
MLSFARVIREALDPRPRRRAGGRLRPAAEDDLERAGARFRVEGIPRNFDTGVP